MLSYTSSQCLVVELQATSKLATALFFLKLGFVQDYFGLINPRSCLL